jgi:hypothetical protein
MTREQEITAETAAWELEIDRFAAGEMSRTDEDRFLARCESEPEQWRAAALACVEHRRLGRLLRSRQAHGSHGPAVLAATGSTPWLPQRLLAVAAAVALLVGGGAIGYRVGLDRGLITQTAVTPAQPSPPIDAAVAEQLATLVQPLLPEAAAQVLREAGIDVHEEPVLYVVDGSNGERWAMPETQLQLRLAADRKHEP